MEPWLHSELKQRALATQVSRHRRRSLARSFRLDHHLRPQLRRSSRRTVLLVSSRRILNIRRIGRAPRPISVSRRRMTAPARRPRKSRMSVSHESARGRHSSGLRAIDPWVRACRASWEASETIRLQSLLLPSQTERVLCQRARARDPSHGRPPSQRLAEIPLRSRRPSLT